MIKMLRAVMEKWITCNTGSSINTFSNKQKRTKYVIGMTRNVREISSVLRQMTPHENWDVQDERTPLELVTVWVSVRYFFLIKNYL